MKYIMFREIIHGNLEHQFPIIFPDEFVHSDIAEFITNNKKGSIPISAGFITFSEVDVSGESETLKLFANSDDEKTIEFYNYFHGLI